MGEGKGREAQGGAKPETAKPETAKPETAKPDQHQGHGAHPTPAGGVMPILQGLGDWHHRVTTKSPEAQRYFDQGLRLTYGFNHDEAVRSFERAVQLDPACAMCHWGVAYALGPNINLPMDAKTGTAGARGQPAGGPSEERGYGGRTGTDRGDGGPLRRTGRSQPRGARRRVRGRDAHASRAIPGRRRRAGAVRRRDDEPPALESVDAGTASRSRARPSSSASCRRPSPASRTTRARATSSSTRSKPRRRPSARCRAPSACRG